MGANKTNFREFMCYNLGAFGIDKNWEDIRIVNRHMQGNMYAWGTKTPVSSIENNPYHRGRTWPESGNPCPSGFRVPTLHEWESILKEGNNIKKCLYSNKDITIIETSVLQVGRLLFLQGGSRHDWINRIWTTTEKKNNINLAESIYMHGCEVFFSINDSSTDDYYFYGKHRSFPVRCIRKLPNEG